MLGVRLFASVAGQKPEEVTRVASFHGSGAGTKFLEDGRLPVLIFHLRALENEPPLKLARRVSQREFAAFLRADAKDTSKMICLAPRLSTAFHHRKLLNEVDIPTPGGVEVRVDLVPQLGPFDVHGTLGRRFKGDLSLIDRAGHASRERKSVIRDLGPMSGFKARRAHDAWHCWRDKVRRFIVRIITIRVRHRRHFQLNGMMLASRAQ